MTISTAVAPNLPYLRRFARAVSGSQLSGDAMVAAALEALVQDVSIFPDCSSDKISLYRLFTAMFRQVGSRIPANSAPDWEKSAQINLGALAPLERQAFLLVAVEGFSDAEAAEVLNLPDAEFARLLASASAEVSKQVATDVLIIEDEPLIAVEIEDIVESLGHRIVGVARTRAEAVKMFHEHGPRMVLADIQLADGSSGLEAVKEMLNSRSAAVIFITAFPERLLTGLRPEPAFLVTKPFMPDMVKALISQALFFDNQAAAAA